MAQDEFVIHIQKLPKTSSSSFSHKLEAEQYLAQVAEELDLFHLEQKPSLISLPFQAELNIHHSTKVFANSSIESVSIVVPKLSGGQHVQLIELAVEGKSIFECSSLKGVV